MRLVAHIIKKYYTPGVDQDDLISIGTIGLIKGVSSYKPEKNVRLATYAARCIENEVLMFFRSQKKLQGEVSLSETLESDRDGSDLSLMDVVGVEDTMLDDLDARETHIRVRQLVEECLTEREADIIRQRYGLGGESPAPSGSWPPTTAYPAAMYSDALNVNGMPGEALKGKAFRASGNLEWCFRYCLKKIFRKIGGHSSFIQCRSILYINYGRKCLSSR